MPANQPPSAESDAQAAAWQRELDRDRLMGRRYVEAERLGGPGAVAMPAAGRNVIEPPGGFAKGGAGLQAQLDKSAKRGASMLPGQGGSGSVGGSGLGSLDRLGQSGKGGNWSDVSAKDVATVAQGGYAGLAKVAAQKAAAEAQRVAQDLKSGNVAGAIQRNASQMGKIGIFRGALMAMWNDITLASFWVANGYALMAMGKSRLTAPLSPLEKVALICEDVMVLSIVFIAVIIIAAVACPFSGSCPLTGSDMLGLIF